MNGVETARVSLVLGGARSGKSRYAEALLAHHPAPWTYIATAQALDDEMRSRIDRHRDRRDARWSTIEAPADLPEALSRVAPQGRPVLVDCLTLWLSNLLLAGADLEAAGDRLVAALQLATAPVVIVSNEVGLGVVPATPLGRQFRDAQGFLNQRIAAMSDAVVFMVAGLPMKLK
jgi:adenosylcobinamide kinase/adenosylcobinamide-phosphate guanylyltransferase